MPRPKRGYSKDKKESHLNVRGEAIPPPAEPISDLDVLPESNLTVRQRSFVSALIGGANQTEAAEVAGYRHPHVAGTTVLQGPRVQAAFREMLAQRGLDDAYLIDRLKELIEAEDLRQDGTSVPNWVARARGLDLAFKVLGLQRHQPEAKAELTLEQILIQIAIEDGKEIDFGD
jgi:hypothetical protein